MTLKLDLLIIINNKTNEKKNYSFFTNYNNYNLQQL